VRRGRVQHRTAAAVAADRFDTVAIANVPELRSDFIECGLERDRRERAVALALQRLQNTVARVMRSGSLQTLEAGVAASHQVILIATHFNYVVVFVEQHAGAATRRTEAAK